MLSPTNEAHIEATGASPVKQPMVPHVGRFELSPFHILLSEWTLCNLGHYCVLAVLSLYLLMTLHLAAYMAALLLLAASLSFRLARLFTAPFIDRLPARSALVLSIALGCLGYLGMTVVTQPLLLVLLFVLIGIGYGSNALIIKVLAANGRGASRLMRYASINTGLNIGAVLGPIVGNALFLHWNPHLVFLFPAGMFVLAGVLALLFPEVELPTTARRGNWMRMLISVWRFPVARQCLLFIFLAIFLYAQLFATLPLVSQFLLHRSDLLASFLVLNALIVVVAQLPCTRLIISLGFAPKQLLALSFLLYASGFLLVWLLPYWQTVYAAVILWTAGEMLLSPSLDTMMVGGVPKEFRVICFTLEIGASALGEGLGSLVGVWLAGSLIPAGQLRQLYLILTVIALLTLAASLLVSQRTLLSEVSEQAATSADS